MGMLDKMMFWKKEPDLSTEFKGFEDVKGKDFGLGGKETGFGMERDSLGLGADRTAGLGGTGDIPQGSSPQDISMRGPGFENVEEPTPLRSAPLERKPIYYQEMQQPGSAAQPAYQQPYQRDVSKDLEVISAKLDTIKSMLDAINHRIDSIERQQGRKGRMEW